MCTFFTLRQKLCAHSVSRKPHKMKSHVVMCLHRGFYICNNPSKEVLNIPSRINILMHNIWHRCMLCANFSKTWTVNRIEIQIICCALLPGFSVDNALYIRQWHFFFYTWNEDWDFLMYLKIWLSNRPAIQEHLFAFSCSAHIMIKQPTDRCNLCHLIIFQFNGV